MRKPFPMCSSNAICHRRSPSSPFGTVRAVRRTRPTIFPAAGILGPASGAGRGGQIHLGLAIKYNTLMRCLPALRPSPRKPGKLTLSSACSPPCSDGATSRHGWRSAPRDSRSESRWLWNCAREGGTALRYRAQSLRGCRTSRRAGCPHDCTVLLVPSRQRGSAQHATGQRRSS